MLLTEILVTTYAFVVGSCVGSFLNVVAWRLPLGMSLIKPASHCPQCKTPIRLRDNVPVLGWILLRGRCRSCGCWISPRYPLVEFAVGAAFAILAWYELATGGSNLPPRTDVWKPIENGLPFDWVYLGMWIYHATLVSILATIALVEFDGKRLGRGFFIFALLAGLLPPLVWPELRTAFLPQRHAQTWATAAAAQQAFRYVVYGAVLGICLAWSFDPRRSERLHVIHLATATAIVGLFLGGNIVFMVVCLLALVMVPIRFFAIGFPTLMCLPRSALVWIATLITLDKWPVYTFERQTQGESIYFPVLVVFGASILLAILDPLTKFVTKGR